MKAVVIDDFEAAPTVRDTTLPEPGEGELIVLVEHASLNGMDALIASGALRGQMEYELPITLGRDFSGTIAEVGPGVTGFANGDQVFGVHFKMSLHDGTFAEQALVPASTTAKRPDTVPSAAAGALGLAGLTASMLVDIISPASGETVLVSGATGGVGAFAIQMLKTRGARVLATAKVTDTFVRSLGADEVVDHTIELAGQISDACPEGLQGVIHLAGDRLELAKLLTEGGRLASSLGFGQDQLADLPVTASAVLAPTGLTTQNLNALASQVVEGRLRVPITQTYGLNEIGQALEDFRSGAVGKLGVITR